MEQSHNRSSYFQYKRNTSILIRWIVTTASSCAPETAVPKPKNNNPKSAKRAKAKARTAINKINSPELTLNSLISQSRTIAEAQKVVPSAVFSLFDSVIKARTAAHACFEQIWLQNPDVDLKESNESHNAFIQALKESRDLLGGEKRSEQLPDTVKSEQRKKPPPKPPSSEETLEFTNRFANLNIESLTAEDEAELEQIALNPAADSPATLISSEATNKGKSKRHVEPLENYKIQTEDEVYFAVCFFIRDLLEMRRHCRDLWKDAGLKKVKPVIAGAITNLAVATVKTTEYELGSDYPECFYYLGVANNLIGKGNYEALRVKSAKTPQEYRQEIQESLLLDCHDDLVTFITDYRKKRNGIPGPSLNNIKWDHNFSWTTATPARRRKWVKDYTLSWLFDLVNTYAAARLEESDGCGIKDAEKLDWGLEGQNIMRKDWAEKGWSCRQLWGPVEFARDITILAMQKVGTPIQQEIKPHHVFQLQLIIDSMLTAERWNVPAGSKTPVDTSLPQEIQGISAWVDNDNLSEMLVTRQRYARSAKSLRQQFEIVKAESIGRSADACTLPLSVLKKLIAEVEGCYGQTVLIMGGTPDCPSLPKSTFCVPNGMWTFSPYLTGTAEVALLNESYHFGTLLWYRTNLMNPFLHLYNMLLENGHISKPIDLLEFLIETFMQDVFRSGRPRMGAGWDRKGGFCQTFSVGIGTKATFSADNLTKRRAKGGILKEMTQSPQSFYSPRGDWRECDHFRNGSKLFALEDAKWVREKIDIEKFPSLKKSGGHECDTLHFFRAIQADLEADFAAKYPMPLLDYNLILTFAIILLNEIYDQVKDLDSDRETTKELTISHAGGYGILDKAVGLAFGMSVMLQDIAGQRIDSPIIRRMGSVFEKTWRHGIEPKLMEVVSLDGVRS